jgi:hypothetical protein
MSGVGLAVLLAILVAIAVLAPVFGTDSRPTEHDAPEGWLGS